MLTPVRCFSCGQIVADKYEPYVNRVKDGNNPKEVLDDLGLFKYCCRRMIVSHIDLIDIILPYSK